MNFLRFVHLELLRLLSDYEFRYYRNNTNRRFRLRYLKAIGVDYQEPISIGFDFYLRGPGNLRVGRNCSFGSLTRIWNYCPIEIGSDFLSAGCLTINSGSHLPESLEPFAKPIRIGDRVWIGVNVTILAGVTIGNDVIVGAGSVVTSDLDSNSIYAGVPAKKIRSLDRSQVSSLWGAWGPIDLKAAQTT